MLQVFWFPLLIFKLQNHNELTGISVYLSINLEKNNLHCMCIAACTREAVKLIELIRGSYR